MKKKYQILVVDDEVQLVELVAAYLEKENYTVFKAYDGLEIFRVLEKEQIDLIVLDVMMPKMDGFTACKKIRESWDISIILLTAMGEEANCVYGLNIGSDDYIVKPFSPKELVARIKALLRRSHECLQEEEILFCDQVRMDVQGRMVWLNNVPLNLTKKEFDLLLFFLKHKGQVFSRDQLHEQIWGGDYQKGTLRTVDTHVKTLRIKLDTVGHKIKTVWGIGYKFEG